MTFSNFHAERIYLCGVSYFENFGTSQTTIKLVLKIKINLPQKDKQWGKEFNFDDIHVWGYA